MNPSRTDPPRLWLYAGIAVLALNLALTLHTFRDYGMGWDQPWGQRYQDSLVRFFTTLGESDDASGHYLRHYGGFFEIAAALVKKATGLGWPDARNLSCALFGLIGIFAILRAGWIAFGPPVGVIAALFLTLTPVYYGHQFINPKDLPFAATAMLALRYIVALALEYPAPRWSTALKAGLALGAALGIRVGGLILFGPLALAALLAVGLGCRNDGFRASVRPALKLLAQLLLIAPLAWAVMVAAWPFAWSDPFWQPIDALGEFSKFVLWDGKVFYDGRLLKSSELPLTYIPNLGIRTLPEHVLLGLLAGGLGLALFVRRRTPNPTGADIAAAVLTAAVVLPVGAIWYMRSYLYDGYRHVLFTIPPLVLLAAAGAYWAWEKAGRKPARILIGGVFSAALALTAFDMAALHPYQYIYFNRSIGGGVAEANTRYDLDYWATGLRAAALWVSKNYNPTPGIPVLYSIGGIEPELVAEYLKPAPSSGAVFRQAQPGEKATLYFLIRRERQTDDSPPGRVLHVIKTTGVPLVDVVERP